MKISSILTNRRNKINNQKSLMCSHEHRKYQNRYA